MIVRCLVAAPSVLEALIRDAPDVDPIGNILKDLGQRFLIADIVAGFSTLRSSARETEMSYLFFSPSLYAAQFLSVVYPQPECAPGRAQPISLRGKK